MCCLHLFNELFLDPVSYFESMLVIPAVDLQKSAHRILHDLNAVPLTGPQVAASMQPAVRAVG
jgi:hypothetical protein